MIEELRNQLLPIPLKEAQRECIELNQLGINTKSWWNKLYELRNQYCESNVLRIIYSPIWDYIW